MAANKKSNGQFPGMEDDTPPELVELALQLKKEQGVEAKAKAKTKETKFDLIEKMKAHKLEKFRVNINGVIKIVTITDTESIVFDKSESAANA